MYSPVVNLAIFLMQAKLFSSISTNQLMLDFSKPFIGIQGVEGAHSRGKNHPTVTNSLLSNLHSQACPVDAKHHLIYLLSAISEWLVLLLCLFVRLPNCWYFCTSVLPYCTEAIWNLFQTQHTGMKYSSLALSVDLINFVYVLKFPWNCSVTRSILWSRVEKWPVRARHRNVTERCDQCHWIVRLVLIDVLNFVFPRNTVDTLAQVSWNTLLKLPKVSFQDAPLSCKWYLEIPLHVENITRTSEPCSNALLMYPYLIVLKTAQWQWNQQFLVPHWFSRPTPCLIAHKEPLSELFGF